MPFRSFGNIEGYKPKKSKRLSTADKCLVFALILAVATAIIHFGVEPLIPTV